MYICFVIICASRRTDIPAFHSEWMMNRLKAGYVLVRNPVVENVVFRIDLNPKSVDCIYFMSKDPRPMIRHIDEITEMGHNVLFQVTVNPYGRDLEPGVPDVALVADGFKELSKKIGKERILWRYDPVLFDKRYGRKYHERKFGLLCEELSEYTNRCIFGFLDVYDKFDKSTASERLYDSSDSDRNWFMGMAGETAREHGMSLSWCCSPQPVNEYGIDNRGCIDRETMLSLGIPFEDVPGNTRKGCRCVRNIDIGAYDSCLHNCVYCYANSVTPQGRSSKIYDSTSDMLYGSLKSTDTVRELTERRLRITDF